MSRLAASPAALAPARTRSVRASRLLGRVVTYALLAGGAVLVSLPFYWLVRSSLMVEGDNFVWPPILWPVPIVWQNYVDIFKVPFIPLPLFFRNSVILVVLAALGELVSTSLTG